MSVYHPMSHQELTQQLNNNNRTDLVLLITFSNILGPTDFACLCDLTASPTGTGVLGGAESGWGVSASGSLSISILLPDLEPTPKASGDATLVSIVKFGIGRDTEAGMTVGLVYERAEGRVTELDVGDDA